DPLLLFWIGLRNTDRTFRWVDGSPDSVGFLNREDCVEMNLRDPVEASWNDAPCGQHRRWLCEKDPRVC
uniref:C-type lectin domain-containing protein n=1 Tax=Scophthalmus maximus TaxID=52904 RepID=A0A8D3B6R8_SCOMX